MKRPLRPSERRTLLLGGLVVALGALRLGARGPEPFLDVAAFLAAGLLLVAGFAWAWTHGLFGGSDD